MPRILMLAFACTISLSPCLAVEAGSRAAYQQRARMAARDRAVAAEKRKETTKWKNAIKLIVSGEVPNLPNGGASPNQISGIACLESYASSVLQIMGPKDSLIVFDECQTVVWLTNYPTKSLAANTKVRLVGPVIVKGTKTYNAERGSNTVNLVHLATEKERWDIDFKARQVSGLYVKWKNKDEKILGVGKFISYSKGKAHFQQLDLNTFEVAMKDLKTSDQKPIRVELKKRIAARKKKK